VKSELADYPLSQLKADKKTQWTGVRNYQARNFLQKMAIGDKLLFYHSNAEPSGVAGTATVIKLAFPDVTQFNKKSAYFDPKSSVEKPRWFGPEIQFCSAFKRIVALEELRNEKRLSELALLQRGSRLSVHPVTAQQFGIIVELGASDIK